MDLQVDRKVQGLLLLRQLANFTPIMNDLRDPDGQMKGMMKRVLRPDCPKPKAGVLTDLKRFVQLFCRTHLTPLTELCSFDEWLEGAGYTEKQKEKLREVWILDCHERLPPWQWCRKVKPFIKAEQYDEVKYARWINASCDKFKVGAGFIFKSIERAVYGHAVEGKVQGGLRNAQGEPYFIKHVPVQDRPSLIVGLKDYALRYLSSDFTAFESHFTPEIMSALEVVLYKYMLRNFPEHATFVCNVLLGRRGGKTRQGVEFSRPAGRMSGDGCTSLGNGFSNLMLWLYWAHKTGASMCGYVEGDDGIFASNTESPCTDVGNFFRDCGFTIKIEEHTSPCHASFCGIICSESLQIIRDPAKVLPRFAWTLTCPEASERTARGLLRAKSISLAYELPHCPVLRAVADFGLSETRGVEARWDSRGAKELSYKMAGVASMDEKGIPAFEPTPDTRDLFCHMFGISPEQQLEMERQVRAGDLSRLDSFVSAVSLSVATLVRVP